MAKSAFSDNELLAYLDELLPAERMAAVERELRRSEPLRRRAASLIRQREQGAHTVGEIWRQERLSCPSRNRLGSFLLGTLDSGLSDYVDFHIRVVGCRYCAANVRDLEQQMESTPETRRRRRRFFQSSAGYLGGKGR